MPATQTRPGRALLPGMQPRRWHRTAIRTDKLHPRKLRQLQPLLLIYQQGLYILVVLRTKKELPVLEYIDKSCVVIYLIKI